MSDQRLRAARCAAAVLLLAGCGAQTETPAQAPQPTPTVTPTTTAVSSTPRALPAPPAARPVGRALRPLTWSGLGPITWMDGTDDLLKAGVLKRGTGPSPKKLVTNSTWRARGVDVLTLECGDYSPVVFTITVRGREITTREGARVGMTWGDVQALYPSATPALVWRSGLPTMAGVVVGPNADRAIYFVADSNQGGDLQPSQVITQLTLADPPGLVQQTDLEAPIC